MRAPLVLCAVVAALAACGGPTDPAAVPTLGSEASFRAHIDLREERAALASAADALSDAIEANGVAAGLTAALADDAVFLSPRTNMVVGKTAIAAFLTSDPIAPSALSWSTIKSDVSNDAGQGYTWTQGSVTIDIGTGPLTMPGMALIYWKRENAGDWQVAAINVSSGGPQTLPIPDGFDTPDTKHRRNFPNTDAAAQADQLLAVVPIGTVGLHQVAAYEVIDCRQPGSLGGRPARTLNRRQPQGRRLHRHHQGLYLGHLL